MEGNEVNWQSRCVALESQLEKFKEQATKVREVIGQKIKVLEHTVTEKDVEIKRLSSDLETERELRVQHEHQIESKAAHIKEWMQKKISEFETQNAKVNQDKAELLERNEKLSKENELLQEENRKSLDIIKELGVKLRYSQEQVFRLSSELSELQELHKTNEYQTLEPPEGGGESDKGHQDNNRNDITIKKGFLPSEVVVNVTLNSSQPVSLASSSYSTADSQLELNDEQVVSEAVLAPSKAPTSPMSTTSDRHESCEGDGTPGDEGEDASTAIKRSSSGKSPSKIPRYVGNQLKTSEPSNPGNVSYYMSLKRGKDKADGNKAKFYIQVRDLESPYMPLTGRFSTATTVDSERDSIADSYCSPLDIMDNSEYQSINFRPPARGLLDSVTSLNSTDAAPFNVNDLYQSIVRPLVPQKGSSVNSKIELASSPPPALPPRNNIEIAETPPKDDVVRTEGQFTSYLGQHEYNVDNGAPEESYPHPPSWLLRDSMASIGQPGSESPPYATLESTTREINLLEEQMCPVYATLKGRASQIRDTPFSGESTDSSDHEEDHTQEETVSENSSTLQSEESLSEPLEDSGNTKVLKTCATYTTVSLKKGDQRKEGYLTKLGGRIKNWKKRWFVLQDGKLYYFKTPNETNRKPLGQVPLDGSCRISRTEGALTIEVATPKRTYYLSGETSDEVDEWLRVLHNVMRKFASSPLLAQMPEKEAMSGWVTKVKHGTSRKSWCVLRGQFLCYYKNQDDAVPFSMVKLTDVTVDNESPDSDEEGDADAPTYRHYTLVLKGERQATPTYLLIDTKQERDLWYFHLTVASGTGLGNMGTDFEKIVNKLMSNEGDSENELWNTPLLTFSREPITTPLTTLPSPELEKEALELFKSILLFTTVATDENAIDYHVALAQNALQVVFDNPELQNEIYCQLVKQTSKQVHRGPQDLDHYLKNCSKRSWLRADSAAIEETIDLRPVQEYVYLQTWQLLAMCTSLFVPKQHFLVYLRAHLKRSCNPKTKHGKYAIYCVKSLERTIANGKREARPSRMEVLSVLVQNPYDHSCRMSLPVHFVDGSCHVFGLDGSTTVGEFTEAINSTLGIREASQSGFAIFTDNPVSPVEHCLQTSVKLCDVISKWEQAMRSNGQGKLDSKRLIKLTYRNRLYFKSLQDKETEKEKYFLVYQTNINVVKGRFPVSHDMAIELAALMAQIQYGDYKAHSNSLPSKRIEMVIARNCPKSLREGGSDHDKRSLTLKMAEKWSTFHGWSVRECVDKYLENARRWPFLGCKLFKAKQRDTASAGKRRASASTATQPVWLAVEEDSINILEGENLRLMCRYKYKHVVTFGGCKDDFMLVVNQSIMRGGNTVEQGTQRLLFSMPRGKILEITLLMASYVNAIVRQQGITCDVPPNKKHSNGPPLEPKVWDLESAEWPIIPGSNVTRLV
ncbi:pleckstrin homology domain-containing family H member 1 isoform X2 [Nematostella vectensis]|uniref:pleckstrin homology domain-containing family H member 1 isoform X2 n=1 Tax=Nematostella vectensis TaxID=45351 RepID=UPI0020772DDC|nr:pleckstrin homology domain-containing family H member 1 isoform X2 [Nematostella vectensis]